MCSEVALLASKIICFVFYGSRIASKATAEQILRCQPFLLELKHGMFGVVVKVRLRLEHKVRDTEAAKVLRR